MYLGCSDLLINYGKSNKINPVRISAVNLINYE
jgi:hypothetical protein